MDKETVKKKLALTEEQQALLDKFVGVWKEMKAKKVGIILDYSIESLSLTAFNESEVLHIGNAEDLDDGVDVEDAMEWGNIGIEYHTYDHYYSNLHAVFGEKTTLNASSAAL